MKSENKIKSTIHDLDITSVSKAKVNAPSHLGYPFTTFLILRIPIKS